MPIPLALLGGAVGAIGSMISAGKKRKALKEQQKQLGIQRSQALAEQRRIAGQYTEGMAGVRAELAGMPTLSAEELATLDLSGARGLYGGLAGEAMAQRSELLGAAQDYQAQLTGAAGDISQRELGSAQMRAALASGGRVQGEELARDAARQATAEAIAQQRRVGGGSSSLLSAIAQAQGQEMTAQRGLSQDFGRIAEQRAMQAQQGLMMAEQAAGARELSALQSGGQAVLQAGQLGGQQVLSALGSQAGAEASMTQAEIESLRGAQLAEFQSEQERALRLANLGVQTVGQQAEFALGAQQLGLDFQSQQNQAQMARQSTSILGAGLGALGGGLMAAGAQGASLNLGGGGRALAGKVIPTATRGLAGGIGSTGIIGGITGATLPAGFRG